MTAISPSHVFTIQAHLVLPAGDPAATPPRVYCWFRLLRSDGLLLEEGVVRALLPVEVKQACEYEPWGHYLN